MHLILKHYHPYIVERHGKTLLPQILVRNSTPHQSFISPSTIKTQMNLIRLMFWTDVTYNFDKGVFLIFMCKTITKLEFLYITMRRNLPRLFSVLISWINLLNSSLKNISPIIQKLNFWYFYIPVLVIRNPKNKHGVYPSFHPLS